MTDTVYMDGSEWQRKLPDETYPYPVIQWRTNDGTHADRLWPGFLAWVNGPWARRRIVCYGAYFVWEPQAPHGLDLFQQAVGRRHRRRMFVVVDVESWGGRITGDHSKVISQTREAVIAFLHGLRPGWQRRGPLGRMYAAADRRRVLIYGNASDLATIDPHRGDAQVILANYDANPPLPHHLVHQYSDKYPVPPWGPVDINSADGLSPRRFARAVGCGRWVWLP